jgi:hypothetical protein
MLTNRRKKGCSTLLTVAAQGYKHKNRITCSFSSHNTHMDELCGILHERTNMNKIREEERENIRHHESEKKVYEREKEIKRKRRKIMGINKVRLSLSTRHVRGAEV